jgi:alpha-L-fucosidase
MKNAKRLNHILIGFFIFSFLFPLNAQITKDEIKEKSMDEMWGQEISSSTVLLSERAKLFDQSNFGMFIHWGLFSNLGGKWKDKTYYGIGEWIMNPRMADIPPQEYMKTASSFNPTEFDAKKIAQLAKDAGMKYIIITSKHQLVLKIFFTQNACLRSRKFAQIMER